MKIILRTFSFLFLTFSLSAQELVDMDLLLNYTSEEISLTFGYPSSYDIEIFKVRYTSQNLEGQPDTLSGLLCRPVSENLRHPLLVYCHGTVASREDVPSRLSGEYILGVLFAGQGFHTIMPDYLGLGDSDGVHPYVHAASEAWASYDMIRTFKENETLTGVKTNEQIFLTGYSQGGHASMALHRYMETNPDIPYQVTAASHLSGPYSISEAMIDFTLGEEPYLFVAYLSNVALSYNAAYGDLFDSRGLASFFKSEYAVEMEKFANDEIDLFDLNEILSSLLIKNQGAIVPRHMLRDSVLNEILNNPNSTIFQALADNDVYDWAPQAPTRIYFCGADEQVTPVNGELAISTMQSNGSTNVFGLNINENLGHGGCITPAVTLTNLFFNSLRDITSPTLDLAELDGISLFPNPANDHYILEDKHSQYGTISLIDITGNTLHKQKYNSGSLVDIHDLPSGNYLVLWQTDRYAITKPLLKN